MGKWYNETQKPLSSKEWLLTHHKAKLPERKKFAQEIVRISPRKVIDLGCGTGLWLDILNSLLPNDCEFVGLDIDEESINTAKKLSSSWQRKCTFICCDFIKNTELIPSGDLILIFNMFPYIKNKKSFIQDIQKRLFHGGSIAIRQYDGASIRFGPMDTKVRLSLDLSLHTSVSGSEQFHHYDLDNVYKIIEESNFSSKKIDFEIFKRTFPFPEDFIPYYENTIKWTIQHLSEDVSNELEKWNQMYIKKIKTTASYFYEVDLVAVLS